MFGSILIEDKEAIDALKKVDGKATESKTTLEKIGEGGAKIGAAVAIGTGAAVGALVGMTAKITETTGAIQDSADRTGMSAEAFQQWSFAAEQSGMSAETLESAMIKQQKAFAEAKTGSETMGAAYAKLGIDISTIGSSSEAFDQVMAKMAGMTDESERNALANDIFGKSYAELTPLLNEGAVGMDALKQQAVDLGGVMSNEAVSSGEALGDTLDQMKLAGEGVFNSVATLLMPAIQNFADWVIANMPAIKETATGVFNGISDAIGFVTDNANIIIPVLAGVVGAFAAMQIISTVKGLMDAYKASTIAQTFAQGGLNAVMAANPIGLVITAIAAIIAIGVALYMNWDKVRAAAGNLWSGISDAFGKIGSIISEKMESAKNLVSNAINAIKGFFNFNVSWPHIPMPHFSINPSGWKIGDLLKGSIPSLGVDWYAKGGIFTSPTLFDTGNGMKGVGEAGPEAVLPLSKLPELLGLDKQQQSVDYDRMADAIVYAIGKSDLKFEIDKRPFARLVSELA